MDDIVVAYITNSYNQDMQVTLFDSIKLLDQVEYINHLDPLVELIMSEQIIHDIDINLGVISEIQDAINAVLKMHTITCTSDTPLYTRVDILNSILEVQSLLDYSGLLNFLRSDADDDSKLIEVIQATSTLTEIKISDAISEYNPSLIKNLIDLLEVRETNAQIADTPEDIDLQAKLIQRLLFFSDALSDYTMLGNALVEAGFMLGRPLMHYIPFVNKLWSEFLSDTIAKQIMSLILITNEGLDNPLMVFRKFSSVFTSDPSYILKLDTDIANLNSILQRKLIEKGVK